MNMRRQRFGELCCSRILANEVRLGKMLVQFAASCRAELKGTGMTQDQIMAVAEQAANEMLLWVGFGTLIGLAAKAIMPGRDPGGAVSTMMMGIGGSVIGCGALAYFSNGVTVSPVSIVGAIVSTGGAFTLLFFYKLLAGSYFAEAEDGEQYVHRYRRNRRRRKMVRGA